LFLGITAPRGAPVALDRIVPGLKHALPGAGASAAGSGMGVPGSNTPIRGAGTGAPPANTLNIFRELEKGVILFIDTTHVSKCNSDVNYIIHEIPPVLPEGVYIHFYGIFYPFEYPKEWFLKGCAWNGQYILRAFLEYNERYKIVLFNTYPQNMYEDELKERFPLIYKNTGGSMWIKKI
jgi:hypothetical protein